MGRSVSGFLGRLKHLQAGPEELAAQLKRVDAKVGGVYEALLVTRKVQRPVSVLKHLEPFEEAIIKAAQPELEKLADRSSLPRSFDGIAA